MIVPKRGQIRNKDFATQIKDMSGLCYGKITPTDIDAFVEFQNKLFVFIEGKHNGAKLPFGQRLALERLVDACHKPPTRIATAIVIDHFDACTDVVDFATAPVREVRWNGTWRAPHVAGITLRHAIDLLIDFSNRSHLRVVK